MDVRRLAKKDERVTSKCDGDHPQEPNQISVIFQRDAKGYGLTVCGDNPVFVQFVTENGPAAAAGLQPFDRIIRVNGVFVTKSNHVEVVALIKSIPYVAMTVVRTPPVKDPSGSQMVTGSSPEVSVSRSNSRDYALKEARLVHLGRQLEEEVQVLKNFQKEYEENPSDQLQSAIVRVSRNVKFYEDEIALHTAVKPATHPGARVWRSEERQEKDERPPTPPPIERIPRHHDDCTTPASPKNSAPNINRRRSNPEAMHMGISRMAIAAGLVDQSALNRSTSSVNVKNDSRQSCSIPDEMPPALPAKRHRTRNQLGDATDMGTPSGSPPPPYPDFSLAMKANGHKVPKSSSFSGASVHNASRSHPIRQLDILTMEDQDFAALNILQGPFSDYFALQKCLPHLSAFLHYLITTDNAHPLLFHLITDAYQKGNWKELQRWVYEIHSTFIVPGAPLELASFTSSHTSVVSAIDEIIVKSDKEDTLRDVFCNARIIALDEIRERLEEFQRQRVLGLCGTDDNALNDAAQSAEKSRDFVESLLGRDLENITISSNDDPENRSDRQAALGCALATFLKINGIKAIGRDGAYLVDKWPLFVQKDKSKFKLKDKSKKSVTVSGHQFAPVSFMTLCFCTYCGNCMWGVAPQGYQCISCQYIVHRNCVKSIEEPCIGEKKERRSFVSMDSFGLFGRKRSNNSPTAIASAKKSQDEKEDSDRVEESASENMSDSRSYVSQVVNRFESGKMQDGTPAVPADASEKSKSQSISVVGRSESLKAQKKQSAKPGVRKKSDPAHFYRDEGDDSVGTSGLGSLGVSGSFSASSQSLPSNGSSSTSTEGIAVDEEGSDFEADPDQIPSWQSNVDAAIIDSMDNRARKRQDVIAELFHTEQTHVRNLKVLAKVFYGPMLRDQNLSSDPALIHHVFPNLEEMIMLHGELNKQMRSLKKTSPVIGNIGDLLLSRFDGENGSAFKRAAAVFCRDQAVGLDALKQSQKKDPKLAQFLQDAASNPLCRRLQLKDIIPTGMQRFTKYPLLLENLLKYTPADTEEEKVESEKIKKALAESREILDYVNQAIKDSGNLNRLNELQEKIDMTSFNKSQLKMAFEHKNLDLRSYRLLYDGDLTWRLTKQKSVDLHVILLDKILVLVTKQDDKLILKFHSPPVPANVTDKRPVHGNLSDKRTGESFSGKHWPPVLNLDGLFVKDVATDPRAFFLFTNATETGAQMYEMVANSSSEQKQWTRQIVAAVERIAKFYETIPETFPVTATSIVTPAPLCPPLHVELHPSVHLIDSDKEASDEDSEEEAAECVAKQDLSLSAVLASPSDLVVTEPRVLAAELVLTPLEQLKRQDEQMEESLMDKRNLVARILGISVDVKEDAATLMSQENEGSNTKVLFSRVMRSTDSLMRLLKNSLTVREEFLPSTVDNVVIDTVDSIVSNTVDCGVQTVSEVPFINAEDLEPITSSLNRDISTLMYIVCQQEKEADLLRDELISARALLKMARAEKNSPNISRPPSCASFRSDEELGKYLDISSVDAAEESHDVIIPVDLGEESGSTTVETSLEERVEEIQHL